MARNHLVWYRRLGLYSSQHQQPSPCSFSSAAAAAVAAAAQRPSPAASRRQSFKQLQPHPRILLQIEQLGIGVPPRKQRSRSFLPSSSRSMTEKYQRPIAPLPFGTKPRLVRHVGKADELITATTASSSATAAATTPNGEATTAAGKPNDMNKPRPLLTLPEVAIAGRSNVGKSTLLNALLFYDAHRLKKGKHKAVVSKKPGQTIEIAIYELEKRLRIVDLPGYGFAYGKKQFQELVVDYLSLRGPHILKRVLLLIDARHGFKTTDIDFLNLLEQSSPDQTVPPLQLVLTKCDQVKQVDLARRVLQVQQQLSDALRREPRKTFPVLLVSVNPPRQVAGVYELQKTIAVLAKKRKSPKKETTTTTATEDEAAVGDDAEKATTATGSSTSRFPVGQQLKRPNARQEQRQMREDHQNRFHRKFRSTGTTTTTATATSAAAASSSSLPRKTSAPTSTAKTTRVDYSSARGGSSSMPPRRQETFGGDGKNREFHRRDEGGVVRSPNGGGRPRTKVFRDHKSSSRSKYMDKVKNRKKAAPADRFANVRRRSTRNDNNNHNAPAADRYSVKRPPARTFRGDGKFNDDNDRNVPADRYSLRRPARTYSGGVHQQRSSDPSNDRRGSKAKSSSQMRKPQKFGGSRSNSTTGRGYGKATRTGPPRKQSIQPPRRKARQ